MRVPQAVRDLARRLDAGWGGSLRGDPAAVPLLAAILARATGRRLILVAAGSSRVEALRAELEVLMPGVVSGLRPLLASPYVVAQGDRVSEAGRVGTLARFLQEPGAARVLVVGAWEWMRRQPPPWFLDRRSLLVGAGEVLDRTALVEGTVALGYGRVDQVEDPGQIAVRGGLIDVFPAGAPWPVRIDLFGDRVDSLSSFDPATQALGEGLDLCVIPPARLVPLEGDFLVRLREALRVLGDELRYPSRLMGDLLRSLTEGQRPPELEVLYPLAVPLDGTVRDFGEDAVVLFDDLAEVRKRMGMIWEQEAERHRLARAAGALVLPPERLYRPAGEAGSTEGLPRWLDLGPLASDGVDAGIEPLFFAADGVQGRSALFAAEARRWLEDGLEVVLLGEDGEVLERTRRILGSHGLGAVVHLEPWSVEWLQGLPGGTRVHLAAGSVSRGFLAREFGLIVAGEADLFGRRAEPPQPARRRVSDAVRVLSSLEEGDLVVHPRYGIGRFLGLETKAAGGVEASFLCLEYAGRDRLYVPVHHADRIQRYVGSEERTAALDRLGGVVWEKRKARAREAAKKLAFDLVQVYAKRQALPGHAFAAGDTYFEEFEATFPYAETTDQRQAIRDVLADMERPTPMDRLVCGDVGFGKTEVAVRAAFKAVLDGRQVAVLVPTTILAEQHRRTFEERLASYPVRVESLSRFKTPARQRAVLKDLAAGTVDIVVGTHRLLGSDVSFRSLGLLVVDEEHRFGVAHKESLKVLRETVDVLSMTATPIPRTLHMAMAGIRDISVIASAPEGRRGVDTQVIRWEEGTVARAIRRELDREGQIFVLHNAVEDLGALAQTLQTLVPEARLGVAHGQMGEQELEKAMLDFGAGRFDVLLCTTIIESGLDLPRVNTLIVNNAHRFGLAQLYQIRGRVGRSERQAFAYFIVPPVHAMTQDARQRLAALQRFTAPGSGFSVATMDLEIRGAGELFGANQSGHMAAVGYELFTAMIEEAVREVRGDAVAVEVDPEIRVPVPASVPEEYVPDRHLRLVLYRRVASCRTPEELAALASETEARLGPFPPAVGFLFGLVGLKVRCRDAGIALLEVAPPKVRLDLSSATAATQDHVLSLLRNPPVPVRMDPRGLLELDVREKAPGPLGMAQAALDLVTGGRPGARS